jgi:predicted nucleic-acid-binding protein
LHAVGDAPTVYVDTNVFLRLFLDDDPAQGERAARLFEQARSGTVRLVTVPLVVAEIVWTLESFFEQPRRRVRDVVEAICDTQGLRVRERQAVLQAIAWYEEKRVDFVDAFLAATAASEVGAQVATFDRSDFRRREAIPVWKL